MWLKAVHTPSQPTINAVQLAELSTHSTTQSSQLSPLELPPLLIPKAPLSLAFTHHIRTRKKSNTRLFNLLPTLMDSHPTVPSDQSSASRSMLQGPFVTLVNYVSMSVRLLSRHTAFGRQARVIGPDT